MVRIRFSFQVDFVSESWQKNTKYPSLMLFFLLPLLQRLIHDFSIQLSMYYGGLGIKRIRTHNKALLAKWLWRFRVEQDSLWCWVSVARFGEKLCWEPKDVRERHCCGIWKSIMSRRENFLKYIKFTLGLGKNIRFWKDLWVGVTPLMETSLNIFQ